MSLIYFKVILRSQRMIGETWKSQSLLVSWLVAMVILLVLVWTVVSSIGGVASDLATEGDLVERVLQEQFNDLQLQLTQSFIVEHSRRKREIHGRLGYKASLDSYSGGSLESTIQGSWTHATTFKNDSLVIQEDGVHLVEEKGGIPKLKKILSWNMEKGDRVIATGEWEGVLFLLTLTKDGTLSKISTLQAGSNGNLVLIERHSIRNQGKATAAAFFVHAYDFYLIICADNRQHSLTISPIYRWSRTYMDEIHHIQTRGAVGVVAFKVRSSTYIAIIQTKDAAGNLEVGTLVLRIFGKGEVEKVQLLWSTEPVSVVYFPFLQEHFLLISQRNNPALLYWFSGHQFLHWQSLEGNFFSIDAFSLPDKEPLLLASTQSTVGLWSRARKESHLLNQTAVVYNARKGESILQTNFITLEGKPYISILVTSGSEISSSFQFLPLKIEEVEIGREEDVSGLSGCMAELKGILDRDEAAVTQLEESVPDTLTTTGDWTINGRLISEGHLKMDMDKLESYNAHVDIQPHAMEGVDLGFYSPSECNTMLERNGGRMEAFKSDRLKGLLSKFEAGTLSGHWSFSHPLLVQNMQSHSPIETTFLNDKDLESLEETVLMNKPLRDQQIRGNWKVREMHTKEMETGNLIGNTNIRDFLLTESFAGKQVVDEKVTFGTDTSIKSISLTPFATINGIPLEDIPLGNEKHHIRGYKEAYGVEGEETLDIQLINNVRLNPWYESLLEIAAGENSKGKKVFTGHVTISNLELKTWNELDWEREKSSLFLNGRNQTVYGGLSFAGLTADNLFINEINSVKVDDWMTTSTEQEVKSSLYIKNEFAVRGDLYTGSVNGIQLEEGLQSSEKNPTISGPVHLSHMSVSNLTTDGKINGVDISAAAKQRKKHIYWSSNGEGIILDGKVEVKDAFSASLNDIPLDSFDSAYWKKNQKNTIPSSLFSFGPNKVSATICSVNTLNSFSFESDLVLTGRDGSITNTVQFLSPVLVNGEVETPPGVTLNDVDISSVEMDIVRRSDGNRKVGGKKEFISPIQGKDGLNVGEVNGIMLDDQLVLLDGKKKQVIKGKKTFSDLVTVSGGLVSNVDCELKGTLNGIYLERVEKDTLQRGKDKLIIKSDIIFSESTQVRDLTVLGKVNGIDVASVLQNLVPLDSSEITSFPVESNGTVIFNMPACASLLNGISPAEYFKQIAKRNDDEFFVGGKKFSSVDVLDELTCTAFNSLDLQQLEKNSFSKTLDQVVSGHFSFTEIGIQGDLETASLSGIPISSFVRSDRHNLVKGSVKFDTSTAVAGNILVGGLVNKRNIQEIAEHLVSLPSGFECSSVSVDGNLSWENSSPSARRLSHLLTNALSLNGNESLSAKVTFENGLHVSSLSSPRWINDIDLNLLREDSLQINTHSPITVYGTKTFQNTIEVKSGPVFVKGKLDTKRINNISLKELERNVVRINTEEWVTGTKTFSKGLEVEELIIEGWIDGLLPSDIVFLGDEREVQRVRMEGEVHVSGDVNCWKFPGIDLNNFLRERLLRNGDQFVGSSLSLNGDMHVQNCSVVLINGVRLSDLVLRNTDETQVVLGSKTMDSVLIQHDLNLIQLSGVPIEEVVNGVCSLHKDEVILREMIFTSPVHLAGPVDVHDRVNEMKMSAIGNGFTASLVSIMQDVLVSDARKEDTTALILDLEKRKRRESVWMDYLEAGVSLGEWLERGSYRVETFIHPDEDDLTIALHWINREQSISRGCQCNSISFLSWHKESGVKLLGKVHCMNVFDVRGNGGEAFTLYSQIQQNNRTCVESNSSGDTFISVSPDQKSRYIRKNWNFGRKSHWSLGKIQERGFVSDVKTFSVEEKTYLVIAHAFDTIYQSAMAEVVVYDVTWETLIRVQGIKGNGATRLALQEVNGVWILAIGNKAADEENPNNDDCDTNSEIYEWDVKSGGFRLLRTVESSGLVDVSIISIQDEGEFHEAFFFLVLASGVNIYKWDPNQQNFVFSEVIEVEGTLGGMVGFTASQMTYLVLTLPSMNRVLFYKYKHMEGFVVDMDIPVDGVEDIGLGVLGGSLLFPMASSTKGGILAEGVLQGRIQGA